MNHYITGNTIKTLREQKGFTQKQLAELLLISDKTISKWETGKGLPDISMLEDLAKVLGISIVELLSGEFITNHNKASKMSRAKFYVCPVCGNVIFASGEGVFSCCGILLPALEVEETEDSHRIDVEVIDNQYHVILEHSMTKKHYISFIAYVTIDRIEIKKLYAEQNPEASFLKRGHGDIYMYCNHHGLFRCRV